MMAHSSQNLLILQVNSTIFCFRCTICSSKNKVFKYAIEDFVPPNIFESFIIAPTVVKEISKIISSPNNCKSSCRNDIPT